MKLTAKDFNKRPEIAYHTAEKGEDEVIINHDRYKHVVFVLTARVRGMTMDVKEVKGV